MRDNCKKCVHLMEDRPNPANKRYVEYYCGNIDSDNYGCLVSSGSTCEFFMDKAIDKEFDAWA